MWLFHSRIYRIIRAKARRTIKEIYRSRFLEICSQYDGFHRLYTDDSKVGDQVASAAVTRNFTKAVLLANKASIFRAELYTITLAMDFMISFNSQHLLYWTFPHIISS